MNIFFKSIIFLPFVFLTGASLFSQTDFVSKVFNVGDVKISVLVDASQNRDASILVLDSKEKESKVPKDFKMISDRVVVLAEYKNQKILFDTGMGVNGRGTLMTALKNLKINPNEITAVMITHMHGDHIGGLLLNDKPAFAKAAVYVANKEAEYFLPPGVDKNGSDIQSGIKNALNIFDTLKKAGVNIVYFNSGDDLSQLFNKEVSLLSEAAYGHTPGHTIYKLKSKNEEFIMWGDILHIIDIQLNSPEISATYDMDKEEAAKARKKVLEYAENSKAITAGTHTINPGAFYIEKNNNGYKKYTK